MLNDQKTSLLFDSRVWCKAILRNTKTSLCMYDEFLRIRKKNQGSYNTNLPFHRFLFQNWGKKFLKSNSSIPISPILLFWIKSLVKLLGSKILNTTSNSLIFQLYSINQEGLAPTYTKNMCKFSRLQTKTPRMKTFPDMYIRMALVVNY